MRFIPGLIAALLTLTACTDHMKTPSDVIPRDKMSKVLWDMTEADRFAASFLHPHVDSALAKKKTFEMYAQIFKLHGVTEEEFRRSYRFYFSRPDLTYIMFDSMSAKAERQRKDNYARINKRDSLKLRSDSIRQKRAADSAKIKNMPGLKLNPGASKAQRDSAIKAMLRNNRRDSVMRAVLITKRRDSAARAERLLNHRRDSSFKALQVKRRRDSVMRVRQFQRRRDSLERVRLKPLQIKK